MSTMFGRRREPLGNQVRKIVYNVYKHHKKCKMCKDSGEFRSENKLYEKVVEVTGISKCSVKRIVEEVKRKEGGGEGSKPKLRPRKKFRVDYIIEGIIRRKAVKHGTITKAHQYLQKENILQCSLGKFKKAVLTLGLTKNGSNMLLEPAEVVTERQQYLKTLNFFRQQKRPIFYLSETQRWKCESDKLLKIVDMPTFIMTSTSGTQGFLNKVNVMLKRKPQDNHFEYFENYDWVKDVVLPNLPSNSVIITNIPFCETPESIMQDEKPTDMLRITLESWLKRHNISYSQEDSESKLLDQINSQYAKIDYSIPKIIRESGHELIHLPENHLDLDPAAIAWHDIKTCTKNDNHFQMASELFINYTPEKFEECFDYVKQIEDEYSLYYASQIDQVNPDLTAPPKSDDSMDSSDCSS